MHGTWWRRVRREEVEIILARQSPPHAIYDNSLLSFIKHFSLLYLHYFTRQLGNVLYKSNYYSPYINSSLRTLGDIIQFGSLCGLPQKIHYVSHIYILSNICQTIINYKLMKCCGVFGDPTNEDIYLFLIFHRLFAGLMTSRLSRLIRLYQISPSLPLSLRCLCVNVTCYRYKQKHASLSSHKRTKIESWCSKCLKKHQTRIHLIYQLRHYMDYFPFISI